MIHGKEIRPPPALPRASQKPPPPSVPDRPKPRQPPPLPVRKNTTEQNQNQNQSQSQNESESQGEKQGKTPPALPPRNRPAQPARNLSDSNTSTASVSTDSSATSRSSTASGTNPLRAPAWGETTLPALPPKRDAAAKPQSATDEPRAGPRGLSPSSQQHEDNVRRSSAASASAPRLPSRPNNTGDGVDVKDRLRPPVPLPKRTTTTATTAGSDDGNTDQPSQRKAPPPPTRPAVLNRLQGASLSSLNKLHEGGGQQAEDSCDDGRRTPSAANSVQEDDEPSKRPLPPPRPSAARKMPPPSLGSLNRKHEETREPPPPLPSRGNNGGSNNNHNNTNQPPPGQQPVDPNRPPPVPLASRPVLSKIEATKPRVSASPTPQPRPATTAPCMTCRDFSAPDAHAAQFSRQSYSSRDIASLAVQLTSPFPSATDKARALFTWLHHNVEYDVKSFFNNNVQKSSPESTFDSGLAVCEGYAGLFERLAGHAGLEARKISGHGKGYSHKSWTPGEPIPPFKSSHAWNVVRIDDGYWKLIDTCWGAGSVAGPNKPYIKQFKPENFTASNDEFGRRHFPTDPTQFYRDDGRPSLSWEEYVRDDPNKTAEGKELVTVYGKTQSEFGIGRQTMQPQAKEVSIDQPGPLRFQFALLCEHWTLSQEPYLYVLATHGVDGRNDKFVPFSHVRGSGPGGAGDMWYVDIADPRTLGAPGQQLSIYALTSFGGRKGEAARGLTVREFHEKYGRTGWACAGVGAWAVV